MSSTKKSMTTTFSITALQKAVENTYDDSRFFVGCGIADDCDFTRGLMRNSSEFISKSALIKEIKACGNEWVSSMPSHTDYLVLNPRIYISCNSINESQIYNTDVPDGYYYSVCKYNPHLDLYIKIDRKSMVISFLLGTHQKTLKLELHSAYTYKLLKTKMYCSSVENLEKFIRDDFWNPSFIRIGRKALGLDNCLLPKR